MSNTARRRAIYIDGFSHKNPIPNAAVIGNLLMTGVIVGMDPETGAVATTLEDQCRLMFAHLRAILDTAGGTSDDILKMTVWLQDPTSRDVLNRCWLALFPDPETRPARHTMPGPSTGPVLIQCDVTAVLASPST